MSADAIVGSVFLICVTVLFVLFGGDPDLMDAIIKSLGGAA